MTESETTIFDKSHGITDTSGPVGKAASGRFFIRMGWANFNSRANNGNGYATEAAAVAAIKKLNPGMRFIG